MVSAAISLHANSKWLYFVLVLFVRVVSCRAANLFFTLVMKVLRISGLSFRCALSYREVLLFFLFSRRILRIWVETTRWSDATLTNELNAPQFFALFLHFRLMST